MEATLKKVLFWSNYDSQKVAKITQRDPLWPSHNFLLKQLLNMNFFDGFNFFVLIVRDEC